MNTQRKHSTHERGIRITLVTLIAAAGLVACGSDDNNATENGTGPAAPVTTEPASATTEAASVTTGSPDTTPVVGTSDALTFVDPKNPSCTYRNFELISRASATEIEEALGRPVKDFGRVTPDNSDIAADLHLFGIDKDPLEAAIQLSPGIEASPNYIYSFAPVWHYAPYDTPTSTSVPQPPAVLSTTTADIAVLDTGWAATAAGTAASTPTTSSPAALPEVSDGRAAGHGTFIVNLLGQLLPNATFAASGIEPRYPTDDAYELSDQSLVNIRDDSTVTRALVGTVGSGTEYLNLSFGSYGCTARHTGSADPEGMEPYFTPLGLRTALEQLEAGSSMHVFAASGNDGRDGSTPEIFYPAGWALPNGWLHSVASDPKDGVDYSNRGTWVETQARGSKAVSLLPPTNEWGPTEHWAAWSGTSFATPCALAKFIQDQDNPGQGLYFENGSDPSGDYMECGVNLP